MNESFVPTNSQGLMPLLVLFHGGGNDGQSQLDLWQPVAEREKVLLLAPTSLNNEWKHPKGGDHIIARMADAFNTLPVDRRRIYLFGHSLGGFMALDFGFANKNAIAAVALHSSTMGLRMFEHPADPASRRLPVGVWSGGERTDTSGFCCATGLQFAYREHPNISVQTTVIPGHCHNDIYSREGLTGDIWQFLKDKTL